MKLLQMSTKRHIQAFSEYAASKPELLDWNEWLNRTDEVIAYARQHLSPAMQAQLFYEMLNSIGLSGGDHGIKSAKIKVISALLDLGHLTVYERADLHLRWGRITIHAYRDAMTVWGDGLDHLLTARELLRNDQTRLMELARKHGLIAKLQDTDDRRDPYFIETS